MRLSLAILLLALTSLFSTAHGQSMSEMKRAANAEFDQADAELNTVYKKVLDGRSPKGTAALKEAQRAWITFRDKSAEAYGASEEGGSLEGLLAVHCSTTLTKERTANLRRMFLSGTESF